MVEIASPALRRPAAAHFVAPATKPPRCAVRLSYKRDAPTGRLLMLLVPAAFMLGLGWYKTAALLLFLFVLRRAVVGLLYDNLLPD